MTAKRWRGKWVADFVIGGRRIRRVSPVQSRRGAQAFEAELRDDLSPMNGCSGSCPTLAEFAVEWLVERVTVVNKPSERIRKESILRVHLIPAMGRLHLDEITTRLTDEYMASRQATGLHPRTINGHLNVLTSLLRCAVEWQRLEAIPVVHRLKVPTPTFDWLRPHEAERLLIAVRDEAEWCALFTVALRTGLRRGELFALSWCDIDPDRQVVDVRASNYRGIVATTKSYRARTISLTSDALAALEQWRHFGGDGLIFPGIDGQATRDPARANRKLHMVLEGIGIRPLRVHELRHSFASHLVLKGVPLRQIQALLGHRSITTTERYAHIADEALTAAIATIDPSACNLASRRAS